MRSLSKELTPGAVAWVCEGYMEFETKVLIIDLVGTDANRRVADSKKHLISSYRNEKLWRLGQD